MRIRAIILLISWALIYAACSDKGTESPYNSSPAPTIIALVDSTYPVDGAVGVSGLQEARIYFSADTDDTTISPSDFSITGQPPYIVRQYGRVVYLDFVLGLDYDEVYKITVKSTISDTLGNRMTEAYDWSFSTGFGPEVESHYPIEADTGIEVDVVIEILFNRDMDPATINGNTFVVGNGIAGEISYSNRTARFAPSSWLTHDQLYNVTLFRWVKDAAGNRLENDISWSFRTVEYIDSFPPTIINFQPAAGATNVSLGSSIVVTFNEPIDTTTVNGSTFYLDGSVSGAYSFEGNSIFLIPDELLEETKTYTVTITNEITDTAGVPLDSNYSWSFTTRELIPPVLMPLAVGNKWSYTVYVTDSLNVTIVRQDSIVIVRAEYSHGIVWYYDQRNWSYTNGNGSLITWERGQEYRSYNVYYPSGGFETIDVTVPAGTFNTFHFAWPSLDYWGSAVNRYFADGVGLVYLNDIEMHGRGSTRTQFLLISYELVNSDGE